MRKKILMLMVFVIFLISGLKAQEYCSVNICENYEREECKEFLYKPENFKNEIFYLCANYTYVKKEDWKYLNQEMILKHNKRYLLSLGCKDCELKLTENNLTEKVKGQIFFSPEGINHSKGFFITPSLYPPDSIFYIRSDAIGFFPRAIAKFSKGISNKDRVYVELFQPIGEIYYSKDGRLFYNGKEYETLYIANLYNNIIIGENISFERDKIMVEGEFTIQPEKSKKLYLKTKKPLSIYLAESFDIKKHEEESYIAIPQIIDPSEDMWLFASNGVEFSLENFFSNEKINAKVGENSFLALDYIPGKIAHINTTPKIAVRKKGYVELRNGEYDVELGDKLVVKKIKPSEGEAIEMFIEFDGKKYYYSKSEDDFVELIKLNHYQSTFSKIIDGLPIIPFHGAWVYGKELGRLERKYIEESGRDILDLTKLHGYNLPVISEKQFCADTQLIIYAYFLKNLYEKGKIDTVRIDGFEWDGRKEFKRWVEELSQKYINTGWLKKNLKEVKNIKDIRPGDVITINPNPDGFGHTIGIKEVYEAGGKRYFKIFAGSIPPIDPRLYPGLLDEDSLKESIKEGKVKVVRWP
jgi:ribosomal 50S subunit-recycling heat shock protein